MRKTGHIRPRVCAHGHTAPTVWISGISEIPLTLHLHGLVTVAYAAALREGALLRLLVLLDFDAIRFPADDAAHDTEDLLITAVVFRVDDVAGDTVDTVGSFDPAGVHALDAVNVLAIAPVNADDGIERGLEVGFNVAITDGLGRLIRADDAGESLDMIGRGQLAAQDFEIVADTLSELEDGQVNGVLHSGGESIGGRYRLAVIGEEGDEVGQTERGGGKLHLSFLVKTDGGGVVTDLGQGDDGGGVDGEDGGEHVGLNGRVILCESLRSELAGRLAGLDRPIFFDVLSVGGGELDILGAGGGGGFADDDIDILHNVPLLSGRLPYVVWCRCSSPFRELTKPPTPCTVRRFKNSPGSHQPGLFVLLTRTRERAFV